MVDASRFGLNQEDMTVLLSCISHFQEVQQAFIFGSRAKGIYKPGSDIDVALKLSGRDITSELSGLLNDRTLLPYQFDLVNLNTLHNEALLAHINRVGVLIYTHEHFHQPH